MESSDASVNLEQTPRQENSAVAVPSLRNTVPLQCAAALLIANSHLESFYPQRWMAADGLLGNSLFFLLSGYGLMCSAARKRRSFWNYYQRRIVRIYPLLWVVVLVFELGVHGAWRTWGAREYAWRLLYPTQYTFIMLIMVFYAVFFFVCQLQARRSFEFLLACLAIPFSWLYLIDVLGSDFRSLQLGTRSPALWWVFFFQLMLVGGIIAKQPAVTATIARGRSWFFMGLLLGAYVLLKFSMVRGWGIPGTSLPAAKLYALLFALTLGILCIGFRLACDPVIAGFLLKFYWVRTLVTLIGGLTLEIYLTHSFVADVPALQRLMFPVNVLAFFFVTILIAWLVGKTGRWLCALLRLEDSQ